ncbi:hypothetical protein K432DRAFT_442673 [Lepidopterella palustris CBS 459.81]|uniref:Uncharacterized protein n=1 Tax=Lepidopterella palustris CBS 459.81 TaxID=1314670 RepID=A0A8E2JFX9_9PEZI|nr:hypothetical protein K432DRAFT_442673 [Lepidopterella palustris CBS 459.81]
MCISRFTSYHCCPHFIWTFTIERCYLEQGMDKRENILVQARMARDDLCLDCERRCVHTLRQREPGPSTQPAAGHQPTTPASQEQRPAVNDSVFRGESGGKRRDVGRVENHSAPVSTVEHPTRHVGIHELPCNPSHPQPYQSQSLSKASSSKWERLDFLRGLDTHMGNNAEAERDEDRHAPSSLFPETPGAHSYRLSDTLPNGFENRQYILPPGSKPLQTPPHQSGERMRYEADDGRFHCVDPEPSRDYHDSGAFWDCVGSTIETKDESCNSSPFEPYYVDNGVDQEFWGGELDGSVRRHSLEEIRAKHPPRALYNSTVDRSKENRGPIGPNLTANPPTIRGSGGRESETDQYSAYQCNAYLEGIGFTGNRNGRREDPFQRFAGLRAYARPERLPGHGLNFELLDLPLHFLECWKASESIHHPVPAWVLSFTGDEMW